MGSAACIAAGVALVLLGALLPVEWYEQLPRASEDLPEPPIQGVTFLRLCLAIEGAILMALGAWLRARGYASRSAGASPPTPDGFGEPPELGLEAGIEAEAAAQAEAGAGTGTGAAAAAGAGAAAGPSAADPGDRRRIAAALVAVTAMGAVLRLYDLGSELWFDEIVTVLNARDTPLLHILTAYPSANNHLLNTLLVQAATSVWGPAEWAVRLPAAIFGIATIPVQYLLARWVLSHRDALLATLLLAVSYHHVFFSQNARGYTGYLLFGMLGTHFFLSGVTRGKVRDWALYVVTMLLAVASVLIGFFVIAAHVLACGAMLWRMSRQGRPLGGLVKRAAAAWLALAALALDLYATVLPQAWATLQDIYQHAALGYAPLSREYLEEVLRGVSQGFGPAGTVGTLGILAVLAAAAADALWRRPIYYTALLAPLGVTGLALLATGLRFSPRFFIWSVPIAFILVVDLASGLSRALRARWPESGRSGRLRPQRALERAPEAVAAALVLLSVWSLGPYYATPKQPSRTAVEWVREQVTDGDLVAAAYLAKAAFMFYGEEFGLRPDDGVVVVHHSEELRRLESREDRGSIWVVTTFPRALRLEYPALYRHITGRYRPVRSFAATVGDGGFTVWRSS